MFNEIYQGKKVLVTGHTGFKGAWLSFWLKELGADVVGYSKYIVSEPNLFEELHLENTLQDYREDVKDLETLKQVFEKEKPEVVFHLAAQPLVRESYQNPKETFDTNLGGTVNVLECLKESTSVQAAVMITSDKCYENVGWDWGYRETDRLGGEDPYSASKACAEIALSAYMRSFFKNGESLKVATARAGNVIGGGDWAADRIVPDCIRAWSRSEKVIIRKPEATRPWQHVLEPVSGYLWLGTSLLSASEGVHGESFNFGPKDEVVQTVGALADQCSQYWGKAQWEYQPLEQDMKEANLLKLSCDKALRRLSWKPVLNFEDTIAMTINWYKNYYEKKTDLVEFTRQQLGQYIQQAQANQLPWAPKYPKEMKVEQ